jgi:hypothetical protein
MNPRNRVFVVLAAFIVMMITIACACPSLSSLVTPTSTPLPPTPMPTPTTPLEPMPGLEGQWYDDTEITTHTIVWDGYNYSVTAVTDDGQDLVIDSQVWNGSSFTWVYVSPYDVYVTLEAVEVSGNALTINWWSTNGNSGVDTIYRP